MQLTKVFFYIPQSEQIDLKIQLWWGRCKRHLKTDFAYFVWNLSVVIPTGSLCQMSANSPGAEFRKWKKRSWNLSSPTPVCPLLIKHEIRQFHKVLMQCWQRNVTKNVLTCRCQHIANLATPIVILHFWRSHCRPHLDTRY